MFKIDKKTRFWYHKFNIISSTGNRVCSRGGRAPSFSSLRSDSSISRRGDYWSLLANITSSIHSSLLLLYYILFGLTLLNKVVYLVLWYRGDEGEPIYRFSHCDHYSDRHKIDKLICDIKAGLILSFGILLRFLPWADTCLSELLQPSSSPEWFCDQIYITWAIRSIWLITIETFHRQELEYRFRPESVAFIRVQMCVTC